jgi:hypothetical protein
VSRWLGSLLPGKDWRVELRPASVSLTRRGAALRARADALRTISVTTGEGDRAEAVESWRAASDVLAEALRERRGRLGRVEIVLSDHFVRYLLIPWSRGLVSDTERLNFARLAFKDLYGAAADSWDLCLDEQPAGLASFAAAVDRALVSSVRDAVTRAGGQLASLVPNLVDRINRHRSAFKARQFCFSATEPGRASLAFRSNGAWQAVRSRRIDGPLGQALPVLLKQEAVVGEANGGGVLYLCSDAMPAPGAIPGWQVVPLAEGSKWRRSQADGYVAPAGG